MKDGTIASKRSILQVGSFVTVRGKSWIVGGAEKKGPVQVRKLISCEDDSQGEAIELAYDEPFTLDVPRAADFVAEVRNGQLEVIAALANEMLEHDRAKSQAPFVACEAGIDPTQFDRRMRTVCRLRPEVSVQRWVILLSARAAAFPRTTILALTYEDGVAADQFLADLGYGLRTAGLRVAGLVQHNRFVRDRRKCDMEVEELWSGILLRISEFRGNGARGCRLDRSALTEAVTLMKKALVNRPALLILNKFGKIEAEGAGLRDVIAEAFGLEIPMIMGVPLRNVDQWRSFAGDAAEECTLDAARVSRWLMARGIACREEADKRKTGLLLSIGGEAIL